MNETDLRIQPYEIRYVHLAQLFRGVCDVLRVCETAMTPKAKRDFVKRMARHPLITREESRKRRGKADACYRHYRNDPREQSLQDGIPLLLDITTIQNQPN